MVVVIPSLSIASGFSLRNIMAANKIKRCAGCNWQRKKCSESCIMAAHFPSTDPHKFEIVHRVFGTSHVLKMLQDVEENERAATVNSMVYEANARLADPVHGSASAVYQLHKQIAELESELAITQEEVATISRKRDELTSIVTGGCHVWPPTQQSDDLMLEDVDLSWEPLWNWKV